MSRGNWVASWRTALRVARREARRAKGRTALVAVMIGIPVLGLGFAAVTYDMFNLTPQERVTRDLGAADATMRWASAGPVFQEPDGNGWGSNGNDQGAGAKTDADLLAVLPAGSRVTRPTTGTVDMQTVAGTGLVEGYGLDLTDPIYAGHVKLLRGHAPAAATEVALTEQAIDHLGAGIGGTITTADRAHTYTVVGVVEFPDQLGETMVFAPGALPPSPPGMESGPADWFVSTPAPLYWDDVLKLNEKGLVVRSRAVLLDPPPAGATEMGVRTSTPDVQELALGGLVVGLCILEVALLAGPAFAVGARRRQRQLALVAASGGTTAHVRRIVLADGIVLGLVGAVSGIVLGILVAFVGRPLVEEYLFHSRAGGYRVFPLALGGILLLAMATGLLAALVPAFIAARQPVVAALHGRRGITRSRKRWLALGLLMIAGGAALAVLGAWRVSSNIVLAGLVVGELGLVLCTPALVGLIARLGSRLPLAPRIALRDTARNRAAAAPAISAVMAAVAGSMALGVYLGSSQAQMSASYQPSLPTGNAAVIFDDMGGPMRTGEEPAGDKREELAAALRANLPVERISTVSGLRCASEPKEPVDPPVVGGKAVPTGYCGLHVYAELPKERQCPYWTVGHELSLAEQKTAAHDGRCKNSSSYWSSGLGDTVVDDGTALADLTGATGDDLTQATAALRAGGVVVADPRLLTNGTATLVVEQYGEGDQQPEPKRITVPAYAATAMPGLHTLIVSAAVADRIGAKVVPFALVAGVSRVPTQAEGDAVRAAVRAVDYRRYVQIEAGSESRSDPTLLILSIAAAVVALGAAGVATGLAAADGRADLSTLAAVGASPRLRRVLSLSQSGVIAGLGALLGVAAGTGVAVAILYALNRVYADRWPAPDPYPIVVPWTNLALLAVVVPVVAMLGAGLLTRSRLPIERRPE